MIHCRSYFPALAALKLHRKFGIKWIFDMRGFWADERVEGKIWDRKHPVFGRIYKFFKKKELQFFNESSAVISLTEAGKREISSWEKYTGTPEKITVIPCAVDFGLFELTNSESRSKGRKELGIDEDAFVVSYLGSLGTWYYTDEMLMFFKQLLETRPNAHFLFITGDKPEEIIERGTALGLDTSKFTFRFAQRAEVNGFLAASDVGMFFIRPTFSKKATSPTKLGEYFATGIPVIANPQIGDVAEIIKDGKNGILVSEFDREAYAKAISKLDKLLPVDPLAIRNGSQEYYDLENARNTYASVYLKLIGPANGEG